VNLRETLKSDLAKEIYDDLKNNIESPHLKAEHGRLKRLAGK